MPPKPATAPKPNEASKTGTLKIDAAALAAAGRAAVAKAVPVPAAPEDDFLSYGMGDPAADEARAKAQIADPNGELRKIVDGWIAEATEEIADLNADLRLARLQLKAAQAMRDALGPAAVAEAVSAAKKPAPKPAASLKAAVRRTGQKHVE